MLNRVLHQHNQLIYLYDNVGSSVKHCGRQQYSLMTHNEMGTNNKAQHDSLYFIWMWRIKMIYSEWYKLGHRYELMEKHDCEHIREGIGMDIGSGVQTVLCKIDTINEYNTTVHSSISDKRSDPMEKAIDGMKHLRNKCLYDILKKTLIHWQHQITTVHWVWAHQIFNDLITHQSLEHEQLFTIPMKQQNNNKSNNNNKNSSIIGITVTTHLFLSSSITNKHLYLPYPTEGSFKPPVDIPRKDNHHQ